MGKRWGFRFLKSFYLPLGCGAIPELYPETSAAEDVTSGWQVLLYSPMLLALVAASSVSRVAEKLCSFMMKTWREYLLPAQ